MSQPPPRPLPPSHPRTTEPDPMATLQRSVSRTADMGGGMNGEALGLIETKGLVHVPQDPPERLPFGRDSEPVGQCEGIRHHVERSGLPEGEMPDFVPKSGCTPMTGA